MNDPLVNSQFVLAAVYVGCKGCCGRGSSETDQKGREHLFDKRHRIYFFTNRDKENIKKDLCDQSQQEQRKKLGGFQKDLHIVLKHHFQNTAKYNKGHKRADTIYKQLDYIIKLLHCAGYHGGFALQDQKGQSDQNGNENDLQGISFDKWSKEIVWNNIQNHLK